MERSARNAWLDAAVLARLSRLPVGARRPMAGAVAGLHRSATRGSSVEFAEYRKYEPGDDVRRLDWRVYARSDRFFVKEFDADTNLRAVLILDTSGSMAYEGAQGSKLDFARRLAATLAWLLIRQGDAVGLRLTGGDGEREIPPRRAPIHLRAMLDALTEARPHGETDLPAALHRAAERIGRRALIVVVSDFFADPDALLSAFRHMRFRRHDLALFHVLDEREIRFDFDRPIRFVDLEGGQHVIGDPALMAREYRREMDGHLSRLRRDSLEFGADYRLAMLGDGYEKALSGFLQQRQRRGTGRGSA